MFDETNSYCTVEDVANRLTHYGLTWLTDVASTDGDIDSRETAYIYSAIDYANNIIDAKIAHYRRDISNRPQLPWLRDRAVDIAAFRVMTLGGRDASEVVRDDYARAREDLERVHDGHLQIPGMVQSTTLNSGRQSSTFPTAINPTPARPFRCR